MVDDIEPFYRQLADGVASAIKTPWQTATVEAIFYTQSIAFNGEYWVAGDPVPKSFEVELNIVRVFRKLREKFNQAGKMPWGQATFHLESSGKFNMNWNYDKCDENGFVIFDEEADHERQRQIRLRQGLSS